MKKPTVSIGDKDSENVPSKKVKLESNTNDFQNCSNTMQADVELNDNDRLADESGTVSSHTENQSGFKDKGNGNEYDKNVNESQNNHLNDGDVCMKDDNKCETHSRKEGDNSKSTVYNNWNFKDIIFPDYGDPLNVQFGGGVPQRYFPPGIPSFSLEKVDREQVLKQRLKLQKNQQTGVKYGQELDSSNLVFSCENPIKKISASNWREYKERLRESLESQSLTFQSPLEQVVPLVRPEDATDTSK